MKFTPYGALYRDANAKPFESTLDLKRLYTISHCSFGTELSLGHAKSEKESETNLLSYKASVGLFPRYLSCRQ